MTAEEMAERLARELEVFASRTRATPVATGLACAAKVRVMLPKIIEAARRERR